MIKEVIVVEGKNDTLRLQSFFDVQTIETHGLGLSKQTLDYIKEVNEKRGVILFLDPDAPGEKIRKRINDYIPDLKNAFVFKEDARTSKKVGIEHASKEVLEEALNNLITYKDKNNSLTMNDLYKLGLMGQSDSEAKRLLIAKKFHIGKCNAKTMLKRLNLLDVKIGDINDI